MQLTVGTFYTYLWLRDDGTPFYVGKGTWGNEHVTKQRAYRRGSPPIDRILIQEHPTEEDAFFAERFLISFYGRKDLGTGCLRNYTEGGEGCAGLIRTKQHCENISKSLSAAKKGKPISHYDGKAHGEKLKGPKNFWWGKKRFFDEEWRRRLSLGKIGHPVSEETKKKMRDSARKYHDSRPKKSHCPSGHPYSGDNLNITPKGYYVCLTCRRNGDRERQKLRRMKLKCQLSL